MLIRSTSITPPKPEIATPRPAQVAKPTTTSIPKALQTGFEAGKSKSNPVDLTGGVAKMNGSGTGATNPAGNVPQAWGNTCGPNTIMAMEAAVDPAQAAKYSAMTGDARAEYEAAVMNSYDSGFVPGPNTKGGWGYYEMTQQVADRFGGVDPKLTANNYSGNQIAAADAIVTALKDGRPVAIGLENHWMAATDVKGEGDATQVLIQDSWTGTSAWVPVSEIANGENWIAKHFSGEGTGIPAAASSSNIWSLVVPSSNTLNPSSTARANESAALANVKTQEGNWTRRELPATPEPTAPAPAASLRWYNRPIAV